MICVVLTGWKSSVSPNDYRIDTITKRIVKPGGDDSFLVRRSSLFCSRSFGIRKFILNNENSYDDLLLVGKSLGGYIMIEKVLNMLPFLEYKSIGLITIDPCWPLLRDFTPNLNSYRLILKNHVDIGVNIYSYQRNPKKQAGSRVGGVNIENIALHGYSHSNISSSPVVAIQIERVVNEIRKLS